VKSKGQWCELFFGDDDEASWSDEAIICEDCLGEFL
jgi:hypothetical protein